MSQSTLKESRVVLISVLALPSEILVDIFLKLPVKSLARARWTCKRWHTIIADPNFVEKHWKDSVKKYPGYLYRFEHDPDIYFIESNRKVSSIGGSDVGSDLDHCAESIRISYGAMGQELSPCIPSLGDEDAMARSSGGLFAFIIESEKCCCICNPIIGEQIKVPIDPLFRDEDKGNLFWWALGYSPTSKVYKIIVLRNELNKRVSRGSIYTLGSDSTWRTLPDDFPSAFGHFKYAECDGNLFFLCILNERRGTHKIVSFDIELEKYRLWKGPNTHLRPAYVSNYYAPSLLTYGDTVAYAETRRREGQVSIWVLRDKVNDVWVEELEIIMSTFVNLHKWINSETIFGNNLYGDHMIYDAKCHERKPLSFPYSKNSDGSRREPCYIYPHIASLVSPKQIMGMPDSKV